MRSRLSAWARLNVAFGWALLLVTAAVILGYAAAMVRAVMP